MTRPRAIHTRIPGHQLLHDGAPHDDAGNVTSPGTSTAGTGRARCTCGATSPVLTTGHARRQWHREHKAQVLNTR